MIRRFTVFGLLAAVAACGGTEGNEAGSRTRETQTPNALDAASDRARGEGGREDRDDCPDRVHFSGVSRQVDAQLNIARRAVCRYRHLAAALADGYVNTGLPCIPGQGYHYIKNSLVGTTDIRHPSVLMYTADGHLNSPEWVAPLDGFPNPPSIFGQVMHADDDLALWIQHVWVWKLNPAGVFEDVNPRVTCP